MKKVLIITDMVLLTMIIIMMVSAFLIPFKINLNINTVLVVLVVYEILNVLKIISILVFYKIKKCERDVTVTLWLRLSIMALIIPAIVVLIYLWDAAAGVQTALS